MSSIRSHARCLSWCLLVVGTLAHADAVPLHYDVSLIDRGFPSPVVRVKLPGQPPAQFLIDTGASMHTLASWFVDAAHAQAEPVAGSARGSTGHEASIRIVRRLDLGLERGRLVLSQALAVEFPPMFAELRIAGLLSPQLLAPAGKAAILDLRKPALTFRSFDSGVDALRGKPSAPGAVCINADSEFANRAYSVPIAISGLPGSVIVDTGATSTVIAAESQIGKILFEGSSEGKQTQGLGGAPEASRHVPAVEIRRGGTTAVLDVSLGASPGPSCGADGLLGMDALRNCVLVMSESALRMSCPQ